MKLSDSLHRRQYKITLSTDVADLDLTTLQAMGIWSRPSTNVYLVILKNSDDPNEDQVVFEKNFKEKTGLTSELYTIEAKYGPATLQNAVEAPWF